MLDSVSPHKKLIIQRRINLERRRKCYDRVCELYEHYISTANSSLTSILLTIKYARFIWKVSIEMLFKFKLLVLFSKLLLLIHKSLIIKTFKCLNVYTNYLNFEFNLFNKQVCFPCTCIIFEIILYLQLITTTLLSFFLHIRLDIYFF